MRESARMPQETLVIQLAPGAQARLERELEGGGFEHRSVEHARFSVKGQGVIARGLIVGSQDLVRLTLPKYSRQ